MDFIVRNQAKICLAALAALLLLSSGTALAAVTDDITQFAKNANSLIVVVYEGIVIVIGSLCLLSVGKELAPAIINSKLRESPEFKGHVKSAVLAVVVTLAFALAPLWVPSLFDFFGASGKIDFSMAG